MKTAIYIENGIFQVVLTGESDLERVALAKLEDLTNIKVYKGSFYECRGGWTRHNTEDTSTIFVHSPPKLTETS